MFSESADWYDLIYSWVNYDEQSAHLASVVRARRPAARTILDIACGTGEHALRLSRDHGFAVDGIDIEEGFLAIARAKVPSARFTKADMRDFHLGRRYDAVICMFSSIGYVLGFDDLVGTLQCFKEHLAPGGVAIVEPWFPPGTMEEGRVGTRAAEAPGLKVTRTSTTRLDGAITRLRFDYEVETPAGVRRATEQHALWMSTIPEMLAAFEAAGLPATHEESPLIKRGMYVAVIGEP